jgi:hypothetical protein
MGFYPVNAIQGDKLDLATPRGRSGVDADDRKVRRMKDNADTHIDGISSIVDKSQGPPAETIAQIGIR